MNFSINFVVQVHDDCVRLTALDVQVSLRAIRQPRLEDSMTSVKTLYYIPTYNSEWLPGSD